MSVDSHYFPLSVALLNRPLQSYILGISVLTKQLRYLQHEQLIHSIPFTRIIRISPYSLSIAVSTPSHSSLSSASASLSSSSLPAAASSSPSAPSIASPALILTLEVVGSRLGETLAVHHHVHSAPMRDSLLSLLTSLTSPSSPCSQPPLLPSFYPLSLTPLLSSAAYKRGKWGGDAGRFMLLMPGGRLLLFRSESSKEPLNVIMLSAVQTVESKAKKRLRVKGDEREYEVGLDTEELRDQWLAALQREREAVMVRGEQWMREVEERRRELEEERRAEETRNSKVDTQPPTPQSRVQPESLKRRTMPSPGLAVNAQILLAATKAAKRSSLSIKTRHSPPPLPSSVTLLATPSLYGDEAKTGGAGEETGGRDSPASAFTPRYTAMPAPTSLSRSSTCSTMPYAAAGKRCFSVWLKTGSEAIGEVELDPFASLEDARSVIEDELDGLPAAGEGGGGWWQFERDGAPISRKQESKRQVAAVADAGRLVLRLRSSALDDGADSSRGSLSKEGRALG